MKNVIMMLIMAVALVALPAMAQQEWQSTSAMQGSGSAYSAQVTAVGAAEVTEMATTTTSTPNNGPRRAKKDGEGSDFGPGGQTGGYQDPNFPIGDAWPLALFAALFAIVITIKKHKPTIMKKNLKTWLVVLTATISANVRAANVDMPAGTYYLDLTGVTAKQLDVFNDITNGKRYGTETSMTTSDLDFDTSLPVNAGITQNSYKSYSKSTFTYIAIKLKYKMTISADVSFFQYQDNGNSWHGWQKYSTTNLTNLGTAEDPKYLGVVASDGSITWQTSGSLPSSTPKLTLSAGANGALGDECTAGDDAIGGGTRDVEPGTAIHLVAEPAEHYTFGGWVRADGSVASYLAEYDFTMPSSSLSLTATFYADNTDPAINGCPSCFRITP